VITQNKNVIQLPKVQHDAPAISAGVEKNQITFTSYQSTEPLSKRYWVEEELIQKQAAAQMFKGTAKRVTMPFVEFSKALAKATDKQAFGYGLHALNLPDEVKLTVSGKEDPDKNVISRTKKYLTYQAEPGVLMLDYDPSEYGLKPTQEELIKALTNIHPAIGQAARIVRGSVSAGVHLVGEQPRADKGFHIYIPVANASDIPRYGALLFDRLWLAHLGFIALSAIGSLLERAVIDSAVFSPERLDFVGKPIISGTGLSYTPPQANYVDGGLLDTKTLQDLTDDEKATVKQLKADKKAAIKPESAKKQDKWIADKVAAGVSIETVNRMLTGGFHDLYDDFILEFPSVPVSVSDVFDNPKAFEGKALADPIEGTSYGTTTAKFYWNDGKPVVNSLAHGQDTKYFLHVKHVSAPVTDDWQQTLDNHVSKWNLTHRSVIIGGIHKIMRTKDAMATHNKRQEYEFISIDQLAKVHANRTIKTGEKELANGTIKEIYDNHASAWHKHFNSNSATGGIVFLPGRKAPVNYFNTWQGFSVEPKKNSALLNPIYYHMKEVVCDGHQDLYDYLTKWIAYTVQNPDKPGGAAIVLRGLKGCGKGSLGRLLKYIWGTHGMQITNATHLVGKFNGHFNDVCFLFADEAFYSNDKQHEGVLKGLITEEKIIVERKGIDACEQPNYLKILMATNSTWAVPVSKDERRYFVSDVSSKHINDKPYFNKLHTAIESADVQAAFLFDMLQVDLTGWHTGDIPESIGLRAQRYHSMDSVQKWVIDSLINGSFNVMGDYWNDELSSDELYSSYMNWCDTAKTDKYGRSAQCVLSAYLGKVFIKKIHIEGVRGKRGYVFGKLEDAISRFEEYEKVKLTELTGDVDTCQPSVEAYTPEGLDNVSCVDNNLSVVNPSTNDTERF